jgi:cytochrome c biogenesis protein CcmG/thiol:disulfide interchange protein DsbE
MKRSSSFPRWLQAVALGTLALTMSGCLAMANMPQTTTASAIMGAPAPDFTLIDLKGNRVSLSHLRGKPVLLNFWTTW